MIATRFHSNLNFRGLDRQKERADRRFLFKAGGSVRTTARRSMKKAKKVRTGPKRRDERGKFLKMKRRVDSSKPGQPPKSHTKRLKQGVRFAVLPDRVLIGPVRAASKVQRSTLPGCALLEHGGPAVRKDRQGGPYKVRYKPRPYMGPALEANQGELPKLRAAAWL